MNQGHIQKEIRWTTRHVYVDIETGEKLEKETVAEKYHIIKIKKHKNVYKSKGTITFTNECKWAGYVQGKLDFGEISGEGTYRGDPVLGSREQR